MSIKLQKRLAAGIKKCGAGRIWLDPNEVNGISMASSCFNVRKLIKKGLIIRKPVKIHSRVRVRKNPAAKPKGGTWESGGIGSRICFPACMSVTVLTIVECF